MAESRGYQLNSIMKGDVGFISDINENFNSSFSPVIFEWLKPETAAERRTSRGGTAWSEVLRQVEQLRVAFPKG